MAPNAVKNALKTAIFTSYMLEKLGYEHVSPCYNEKRTDLIQTLDLHSKEKLVNFTQGINHQVQLIPLYVFFLPQCLVILLMKLWLVEVLLKEVLLN